MLNNIGRGSCNSFKPSLKQEFNLAIRSFRSKNGLSPPRTKPVVKTDRFQADMDLVNEKMSAMNICGNLGADGGASSKTERHAPSVDEPCEVPLDDIILRATSSQSQLPVTGRFDKDGTSVARSAAGVEPKHNGLGAKAKSCSGELRQHGCCKSKQCRPGDCEGTGGEGHKKGAEHGGLQEGGTGGGADLLLSGGDTYEQAPTVPACSYGYTPPKHRKKTRFAHEVEVVYYTHGRPNSCTTLGERGREPLADERDQQERSYRKRFKFPIDNIFYPKCY